MLSRSWVAFLALAFASACTPEMKQMVQSATSNLGSFMETSFGGGAPANDGTGCYAPQRVSFYKRLDEADQSRSAVRGIGTIAVSTLINSTLSGTGSYSGAIQRSLQTAFEETVAGMLQDVRADETRAAAIRRDFDALMACRRREAGEIQRSYDRRAIKLDEARSRMDALRALNAADLAAARKANQQLEARANEFAVAAREARQEAKVDPGPQRRQRERQVSEVEAAVQSNQKVLDTAAAAYEEAERMNAPDGAFRMSRLERPPGTVRRALA